MIILNQHFCNSLERTLSETLAFALSLLKVIITFRYKNTTLIDDNYAATMLQRRWSDFEDKNL